MGGAHTPPSPAAQPAFQPALPIEALTLPFLLGLLPNQAAFRQLLQHLAPNSLSFPTGSQGTDFKPCSKRLLGLLFPPRELVTSPVRAGRGCSRGRAAAGLPPPDLGAARRCRGEAAGGPPATTGRAGRDRRRSRAAPCLPRVTQPRLGWRWQPPVLSRPSQV